MSRLSGEVGVLVRIGFDVEQLHPVLPLFSVLDECPVILPQ